jgi:hypothetical protein
VLAEEDHLAARLAFAAHLSSPAVRWRRIAPRSASARRIADLLASRQFTDVLFNISMLEQHLYQHSKETTPEQLDKISY